MDAHQDRTPGLESRRKLAALLRDSIHGARAGLGCLLAVGALFLGLPAHAASFTQTLDFKAPTQSFWGPGGSSASFDYSGSVGWTVPVVGTHISAGYSVGASSGTVSGEYAGQMSVVYQPQLASPGATTLQLYYQNGLPDTIGLCHIAPSHCFGGRLPADSLTSDLGTHATLSAAGYSVGPDFTLSASNPMFGSYLGQTISASASDPTAAQLSAIDLGVVSAGVSLGLTQTDQLTATGISGDLYYSRQGSGVVGSTPSSFRAARGGPWTSPCRAPAPGTSGS